WVRPAAVRWRTGSRSSSVSSIASACRIKNTSTAPSVPCTLARMKLYGTTTSPFVRRVRVVAAEVGEPVERIDTAPEAGQAALREVSPIRKVPVAVIDGRTLFDSHTIIDWLVTT